MHQLPTDILRLIALNLSIRDILNLCQTNKQYQQYICNNKPFWAALLLRETKSKINIPPDANINWYKEKVKNWPSVKILVEKIKSNKVDIEYIKLFNDNWDHFEIVENLKELHCSYDQLTSLPPMPNLQILNCENNKLTSLPPMPNLQIFFCRDNQLTSLPLMPNLRELYCNYNQLTSLPSMPNLQVLNCGNNQLTSLPSMPNLHNLYCKNNLLPFDKLYKWKQYWEELL
jgi:Leucine-rich repeat (LRR) protein